MSDAADVFAELRERIDVCDALWTAAGLQASDRFAHLVVVSGLRNGWQCESVASTWPDPPPGARPWVDVPTGHLL